MVFGVEPEAIDWSMTLSQPVKESLPYMVAAVVEELGGIACNVLRITCRIHQPAWKEDIYFITIGKNLRVARQQCG